MIYGYFGLPRVGKTYTACYRAYLEMKKGRSVYSNIPLRGAFFLDVERLGSEFYLKPHSLVFIDEIQWYANSRQWQNLADGLYFLFSQSGKMSIDLLYTAQDSSRVDKTLREVTNIFYQVHRYGRVLVYDVYYNNVDYSLQRNNKRTFGIMRRWFWAYFDTSYWVTRSDFVRPAVPDKQWTFTGEKWEVVPVDNGV